MGAASATGRKDASIESLRGLAIILMVAGHVIGSHAGNGMQVADDSAWRYSYRVLEDLRMPLFTVLSGFVYAYRPVGALAKVPGFLRGKGRRLLVPLVTVGTLFFFVQFVVPGTNGESEPGDLWRIYVFGYQHFWFLQSIFLIFVVVGLLDACGLLRTHRRWLVAFSIAALLFIAGRVPAVVNVFSLNGAIRLLPFFLLGYGLHRYAQHIERRAILTVSVAAFAVVFLVRLWTLGETGAVGGVALRSLSLSVGVFGLVTLMLARQRLRSVRLAWLGQYAFGIYLLHVFGSAGTRIALGALGLDSDVVVFLVGMVGALGLPIVLEVLFGGVAWISWAVFGQRPRRQSGDERQPSGRVQPRA